MLSWRRSAVNSLDSVSLLEIDIHPSVSESIGAIPLPCIRARVDRRFFCAYYITVPIDDHKEKFYFFP